MYPSSAGCGTSWRSFSARESGRRTERPSPRASRTCTITRRTSGYVPAPFRLSAIAVFPLPAPHNPCVSPGGGEKFLLFCEGTRFTPKKHRVSMEVAESKGLPKLKYHLLPRTKGFWVTVQNLRGTGERRECLRAFANQMISVG